MTLHECEDCGTAGVLFLCKCKANEYDKTQDRIRELKTTLGLAGSVLNWLALKMDPNHEDAKRVRRALNIVRLTLEEKNKIEVHQVGLDET